ncbi:TIGR02285 family protein [Aquitalea sp. LB_tupeE]|uniref:TIGR02285 family protein n=1 Tax=Aquitalea sp. LB_tupeE TaxID=2748078 RepID=UPI0015BC1811|nr:TIGR02285 family protein [Aquitalea sp. LB_tupeE]NWK79913.1 TIGR02285 family protein [Aquitalea sp. LB_tupeE]
MVAATALSALPSQCAQAEQLTVNWQMPDYPPVIIASGPAKGQGYADVFLQYLMAHTPDLKHVVEYSSMSRVFGLMKQGLPVCEPSLLKTAEREQYVDFSDPVEFVLPHHVVVRADRLNRLHAYRNAAGAVDIARLMRDTSLISIRQEKRGYPPVVLDAMQEAAGKKNLIQTSDDDEGPFRQLASGWVDYIISYPDEINWFANKLNLAAASRLVYLPIVGLPDYTLGYVGCTKGPWGKKIIQRVNKVLARTGKRPPWIDAEARWLDPEAARHYEDIYRRYQSSQPSAK